MIIILKSQQVFVTLLILYTFSLHMQTSLNFSFKIKKHQLGCLSCLHYLGHSFPWRLLQLELRYTKACALMFGVADVSRYASNWGQYTRVMHNKNRHALTAPYRKYALNNSPFVKCFEDDLLHVPPASVETPLPSCVCCYSSGSSSTKHHVDEWFDWVWLGHCGSLLSPQAIESSM